MARNRSFIQNLALVAGCCCALAIVIAVETATSQDTGPGPAVFGPPRIGNPRLPLQPSPTIPPPGAPAHVPLSTPPAASLQAQDFEDALIIARVGRSVILASDVLPAIDQHLKQYRDRIPADQLETQRWLLARQLLDRMIEVKLVFNDATRTIPAERVPDIEKRINEQFEKNQIDVLMKRAKVGSRAELEAYLAQRRSSLKEQRRKYFENVLAVQWVQQQVNVNENVSHEKMVDYYARHAEDFDVPAKARWEQLAVELGRYPTEEDRRQARSRLGAMGNDVLRGVSFGEVAKAGSDGQFARQGGVQEATFDRNYRVSEPLRHAITTLPVGKMSRIIEDQDSFHVVRVIERTDAHHIPFRDAQVDIKKKIIAARRKQGVETYYARLREEVRVWMIYDEPAFQARFNLSPKRKR